MEGAVSLDVDFDLLKKTTWMETGDSPLLRLSVNLCPLHTNKLAWAVVPDGEVPTLYGDDFRETNKS